MAVSERSESRVLDERLMATGTGARFALVVILALVTSAKMVLEFSYSITGQHVAQCELAAGIDVFRANSDVSVLLARLTQYTAYTNCEARFAPPPPWWLPAGWPLLVLVVAVLFFYADRWRKLQGAGISPLKEFDGQVNRFPISKEVLRLAQEAGLSCDAAEAVVRRCVVDDSARTTVVLGTTRRPVLRLHLGLVALRLAHAAEGTDDPQFRAVLLHEFAHIRYGDVTAYRSTLAVWRAFLTVALIPYMAIAVFLLRHGTIASERGISLTDQRDVATTLVLVCLGYLARMDALRYREIYADREAWRIWRKGADPGGWPARARPAIGPGFSSWPRRAARALAESLRSHPRWDLRAESLRDPTPLFVVQALPVFLAGAAAAFIDSDFQLVVQIYGQKPSWLDTAWMVQATGAVSAALVTLVVGVALWRSVAYRRVARCADGDDSDDEGPGNMRDELAGEGPPAGAAAAAARRRIRPKGLLTPTGLRTGLWLGTGMVAGDLVAGQGTIDQLVPARPEVFLLVLAAGAAFGWWTAQCAGAWLAGWQGRIQLTAMIAGLAAGFLMLSWWFTYWADAGIEYAAGFIYTPSEWQRYLEYQYGIPVAHPQVITAVDWAAPLLNFLKYPPADLLAVGAAWVVPLMAWAFRRRGPAAGLPSLRAPLAWAAGGAVAIWACSAGAQAYMHQAQPARPPLYGIYEVTYVWLLFAAQALPAAAVALIVGLGRGRYQLLVTLIAVEAAVLAGLAGTLVLISADGCIRPLATLEQSCAWRPGLAEWAYGTFVDLPALLGAVLAFAACALAFLRPATWKDRHEDPDDPTLSSAVTEHDVSRWRAHRGASVLAGAAALGVALTGLMLQFPQQTDYLSASATAAEQASFQVAGSAVHAAAPPQVAALEAGYWSDFGGESDLSRVQDDVGKISSTTTSSITKAVAAGHDEHLDQDYLDIGPFCADIVAVSGESREYFVPPVTQAQTLWSAFVNLAWDGGHGCEAAISLLRAGEARPFLAKLRPSLAQLATADSDSERIEARITAVEEDSALPGSRHYIASPGPLGILPPPPGSTPFPYYDNGRPLSRDAFIQGMYDKSSWIYEENLIARSGFVSGAIEVWDAADGSREWIAIARFSSAEDARSWFDNHVGDLRPSLKSATAVTDPSDDGMGWIDPTINSEGYAAVKMETCIGSDVIAVTEYTLATPDPAAAKALLLKQYDILKEGA